MHSFVFLGAGGVFHLLFVTSQLLGKDELLIHIVHKLSMCQLHPGYAGRQGSECKQSFVPTFQEFSLQWRKQIRISNIYYAFITWEALNEELSDITSLKHQQSEGQVMNPSILTLEQHLSALAMLTFWTRSFLCLGGQFRALQNVQQPPSSVVPPHRCENQMTIKTVFKY